MEDNLSIGSKSLLGDQGGSADSLEKGNTKHDSARGNKTAKLLLIVILCSLMVMVFMSLTLMVIHLNNKVNYIQELSRLQRGISLDISQQLLSYREPIPEDVQSSQSKDIGRGISSNAVHLTGKRSYQRIDDSETAKEPISNWQDKSKSGGSGRLQLVNGTMIQVEEDGFYMIYAQISWRMKEGLAMFEISKGGQPMAKCINSFQEKYAVMKTCYTAITANLRRGDSMKVEVLKDDFSIDYDNGRSFFGAVSLDQN